MKTNTQKNGTAHQGVLWDEIKAFIDSSANKNYLETNFGSGSYSKRILDIIPTSSQLLAFDLDKDVELYAKALSNHSNFVFINDNFINMKQYFAQYNINHIDCLISDLGFSMNQVTDTARGFSYDHNANLDMRYDQNQSLSAFDVVNSYSQAELTKIFFLYSEEKNAKQIARRIIEARKINPIKTTLELKEIIQSCSAWDQKMKAVRRIFQAIRVEVNSELSNLTKLLDLLPEVLNLDGKALFITFNSIEDRLVKKMFQKYTQPDRNYFDMYHQKDFSTNFRLHNKKPIIASQQEVKILPHSLHAKLRIIERISW